MAEWTSEAQRQFAKLLQPVLEKAFREVAVAIALSGDIDDKKLATYRELADLFRRFVASIPSENKDG